MNTNNKRILIRSAVFTGICLVFVGFCVFFGGPSLFGARDDATRNDEGASSDGDAKPTAANRSNNAGESAPDTDSLRSADATKSINGVAPEDVGSRAAERFATLQDWLDAQTDELWGDVEFSCSTGDCAGLEFFERSCRDGSLQSCRLLAQTYERGEMMNQPPFAIERTLEEACDDDVAMACRHLVAVDLSRERYAKAYELLEHECAVRQVSGSCYLAAKLIDKFEIDTPDESTRLMSRACELDHAKACLAVAEALDEEPCSSATHRAYRRACELGSTQACSVAASQLENGCGVASSRSGAFDLQINLCRSTGINMTPCFHSLRLANSADEMKKATDHALPMLRFHCKNSHLRGCIFLAEVYRHGHSVERDPELSELFFKAGCTKGDSSSPLPSECEREGADD